MQENHGIAVWLWRTHEPRLQRNAVGRGEFHIAKLHGIFLRGRSYVVLFAGGDGMSRRMHSNPTESHPAKDSARQV